MVANAARLSFSLAAVFLFSVFVVLFMNPQVLQSAPIMMDPNLQTFKTMFVSITLEAFPFILLGVVVSSIIQVFVPESFVRRIIPKQPLAGVVVASLLGLVFPVCECGMVPVARRLIRKGFPVYAAVVFLLAGPIVNPVVFSATYMAFRFDLPMVYARMGLAIVVAIAVGLAVYKLVPRNPLKEAAPAHQDHHHGPHGRDHTGNAGEGGGSAVQPLARSRFVETFDHAAGEFFDMGKYLIFGAFLTALVQTFVPRSALVDIAQNEWASSVFMMGFAYIISICSTSDAFVAISFASTFSSGALLAFLVFGPMMDLKSTFMLLSAFRARFVFLLIALVAFAVWIGSYAASLLFF
ncbi:permease [Paenibacillus sp. TRM 82003]|nr:permease [Paenibacillus sp. TRM 82003]